LATATAAAATAAAPTPTAPAPADSPADVDAAREELLQLHGKWAKSMTDASPDPKDTRKAGPPLTEDESRRLYELHYLAEGLEIPVRKKAAPKPSDA
jgi:hypothetical protein